MKVNTAILVILCSMVVRDTQTYLKKLPDSDSWHLSSVRKLVRRQTPQFPIPTLVAHYIGIDDPEDICDREETYIGNGTNTEDFCFDILSQGPCQLDELVLVDATTRKGYCGNRICGPDRVFLFGDQMCHDPWETGICPPGRMLSTSAFGTPICGCPDGTYESDDDLDDDVCDPLLSETLICPKGQIFWFNDFDNPPLCRNDPCNGLNLQRNPIDLPFIPSYKDGQCYQIGTQPIICAPGSFYAVDLEKIKGVCESLDDAGYLIFDNNELNSLVSLFGDSLTYINGNSSNGTSVIIDSPKTKMPTQPNDISPTNSSITQGGSIIIDSTHTSINTINQTDTNNSSIPSTVQANNADSSNTRASEPSNNQSPTLDPQNDLIIISNCTEKNVQPGNDFDSDESNSNSNNNSRENRPARKKKKRKRKRRPIRQNNNKKRPRTPASTTLIEGPQLRSHFPVNLMMGSRVILPHSILHHSILTHSFLHNLGHLHPVVLPAYHTAFKRSITNVNLAPRLSEHKLGKIFSRPRLRPRPRPRPRPFASPGNVFEPGLTSCRAGASKGLNAKCRPVILPSRYPPSRPKRRTPPIPPRPICGYGSIGIGGSCGRPSSSISSAINALGLGR